MYLNNILNNKKWIKCFFKVNSCKILFWNEILKFIEIFMIIVVFIKCEDLKGVLCLYFERLMMLLFFFI